jgi:hypothetical protein
MSDTTTDALKRKIAALLAMAHDKASTPAEAEAFAEKARSLMEQHQLGMNDVLGERDPLGKNHVWLPYDDGAYKLVAIAGAEFLGCAALFSTGWNNDRKKRMTYTILIGRESARITAEALIGFWIAECNRTGRAEFKRDPGQFRNARDAIHQVMNAFAVRLRLLAKKTPARAMHSALPVPISEAQAIVAAMATREGRKVKSSFSSAAAAAAERISLATQVAQTDATTRIARS